jgi:hypothetical protein
MIEISFLPSDAAFARLKMLPIANDLAHRLVAREGKKGMEMIWHEQKQRDVPALFDLVKSSGIQQRLRERGVSQWASLFFAVNGDSDVKQRAGLDPVRDFMMQFGREPAVEHRVIVKRAFARFKVDRPLRRTMLINAASPPFLTSSKGLLDPPKLLGRAAKQLRDFILHVFQFIESQLRVGHNENVAGRFVLIN